MLLRFDEQHDGLQLGRVLLDITGHVERNVALHNDGERDDRWQFAVEGVRISGSLAQRAAVGAQVQAVERQLQLAVRWTF